MTNNTKKKLPLILLVIGLISLTLGVTMAFYNYARVGDVNTLAAGRIHFTNSEGTSINLTNVFPIESTEIESSPYVGSVTITVTGDTTYTSGIEYLISAIDVANTVNGKKIPISTSITVNNIGTSDDSYFTNRGGNTSIYKNVSDNIIKEEKQLVVGYITSGVTGINGSITIKAYIDAERIAITDTYTGTNTGTSAEWVDDRLVFTRSEWLSFSTIGVSFKVKVEANEGIWVEEEGAYNLIKKNADITKVINFASASSSTNGEGIYRLLGTENDEYPIYYYRGAINNNNVLFAGYCWQMVRTTETGGIKMIYNGLPDIEGSGDNITYNCGTTRDIQDTIMSTTSLQESTGYYYADDYEIVSTTGNSVTYRLKSKTNPITQVAIANATAAASNIPIISTNYPYTCKQTTDTGTCTNLYKVDSYSNGTNANVYSSLDRPIIGRSAFNTQYTSVSDVGYMSNTRYPYSSSNWTTNALFASTATWVTDHYELTDATLTSPDATHHYSCNQATSNATCTSLRYVHYVNEAAAMKYYISLTNGDLIEDALYKMTGNGSVATKAKNSGYVLNQNNSTAKETIDNWFRTNLTSEINQSNQNYSVYLEDTVYCNDRSFKTMGSSDTYDQSGWNPTNGNLSTYLYFGTHNRVGNSWYSSSNVPAVNNIGSVPNIACPNESDRFTVSNTNGNGALTYPVGLLTTDEMILVGLGGYTSSTSTYYLNTNDWQWSLTPYHYVYTYATEFEAPNYLFNANVSGSDKGLRPVVSLKHDTEFDTGGDGTGTNPYVVKYN